MTEEDIFRLARYFAPRLREWLQEQLDRRGVEPPDAGRVISILSPVGAETAVLTAHQPRRLSWLPLSYHCFACGLRCSYPTQRRPCAHCHQIFHPKCHESHLWNVWQHDGAK